MSNDGKDIELELATESEERIEHLSATLTKASLYPMLRSGSEGVPGDQMKIRHYLFNAWPDHGVPTGQAVQKLKALVEHIGQERERLGDCEVWVHWYIVTFSISQMSEAD
jgi:protein-tyrosine phosphatase